ncbi:hypothetical protein RhiLY_07370 [Ceratobasidium sp. AG-Ba]|nr:hypothetical protein RhiLY_07370 [Ceratobasidium sp. AG-Ba]
MSSDYGDEDEDFLLNLGDDDLRMLEEVEEKCGVQVSNTNSVVSHAPAPGPGPSTRGINPPPPKRAKVTGLAPIQDALSDDDNPDILVNPDGTYSLDSPEASLVSIRPGSLAFSGSSKHLAPEPAQQHSASPVSVSTRNGTTFAARPLQRHDSSTSMQGIDTPPSTQGTQAARPLVRAASLSQAISRGLARSNAPPTQQPIRVESYVSTRAADGNLQKEIEALRAQLAQAESERQKLRISLEETKENSFAKAGEAENLRRTMQKQNERHAEEISRLRQEMTDTENAKLDIERRMKLEMDQLRTSLTFKQHEKETSRRGFPNVNSTIKKRQAPGSTQTESSTPSIFRMMDGQHSSPLSPKKRVPRASMAPPPVPGKLTLNLHALVITRLFARKEKSFSVTNSFNRSTSPVKPRNRSLKPEQSIFGQDDSFAPVHTSTQNPSKDKGKARAEDGWMDDHANTPVQRLTFGTQTFWDPPRPATQAPFALEPDVFGSNAPPQTPARVIEAASSVDLIEPMDYADEAILFRPPEGQKTFSLQHLLMTPVSPDLHKRFSVACTGLFDAFGASSNVVDAETPIWDQCASKASLALVQIAQVFDESKHLDPLRILFDLLNLVSEREKLDDTVLWHLGETALALCETLGWQAMDDGVVRLSALARTAGVLPLMLDTSYPAPWIAKATRALCNLASRPALVRGLLSFPDLNPPVTNESTKVPLVELLSRHLSAYRKHETEEHHKELYSNILTALSQVAITDTQSLTTLVDSLSLIPSLVSFICHVSSAIWSELELVENRALGEDHCLIDALRLAVQLLHYLSFSSDPEPNVRERLLYAPHGPFNGLVHMFIVAFGRLSSGDPPEYLDETCSASLREIRGVAEALLGIVVDGPEVEGIYDVFHDSEEDDEKVDASVEDEDENEEALKMSLDEF